MGKIFNQGDESFVHGKVLCTNKIIEKSTNNWKDIMCSWIGKIIIVKITILLKENESFSHSDVSDFVRPRRL